MTERRDPDSPSSWRIAELPWDHPDSRRLRHAQRAEITEIRGLDREWEPGPAVTATDIALTLVAHDAAGEAIACASLRDHGHGFAELKRMDVCPDPRGSGVAAALLGAIEREAAARGWTTIRIQSDERLQSALRFYTREGYGPVAAFEPYRESPGICFLGKRLVP